MEEDILYHYTSVETLFNIFNNMENGYIKLRASYFMNMNDPIDCCYFFSEVKQIMAEESDSKDCNNKIEETILEVGIPYIISFSSAEDSLPMWNMYAQKGHGVSIGFFKKEIDDATRDISNRGGCRQKAIANSCFCKLYDCKYWNTDVIKEEFVQKYILDKTAFNNKITDYDICSISYLVKHPSYSYEDESRVVFLYSVNQMYGCLKYIDLLLPISSIRKIVCGPCANRKNVEEVIHPYINSNMEIEESKIPYTDSPQNKCPLSLLENCGVKNTKSQSE